jgi:hypothetical protein
MKKRIVTILALVVLIILGITLKSWLNPRNHPEKVSGKQETLVNMTAVQKELTIKNAGYYDLTAVKSDARIAGREFPLTGQTNVGTFFKKNQKVTLNPNTEVEMIPSEFAPIKAEDGVYKLQHSGHYLAGTQFPAGQYTLSLEGSATDGNGVQLIVETVSGKVKKEISLSDLSDKKTIDLPKKTFLRVKKGFNADLLVVLEKK